MDLLAALERDALYKLFLDTKSWTKDRLQEIELLVNTSEDMTLVKMDHHMQTAYLLDEREALTSERRSQVLNFASGRRVRLRPRKNRIVDVSEVGAVPFEIQTWPLPHCNGARSCAP